MQAGLLTETIIFEEAKEVKTESGFVEKEFVQILTTRAYRKKLSASSIGRLNAYEEFLSNTIIFQTRFHPAINEKLRIQFNGYTYKIILLDRQRRDNTYLITCTKENN